MNVTRTLTLGVVGGSIAVWLAGAATSTVRHVEPRVEPRARAADVSSAALASEVARLHDRLRPTTAPTEARDLFHFGRRAPSRSPVPSAALAPAPAAPVVAAPPTPSLTLVGIAEDATEQGLVRMAIVSGFGELFMVREHETIASRFRVNSISAEGVELTDTTDQTTVRLAFN
jgi:hypothetical protein